MSGSSQSWQLSNAALGRVGNTSVAEGNICVALSLLFILGRIQAVGNRYVAEGNISVVSGFVFWPVCLTLSNEKSSSIQDSKFNKILRQ